MEPTSKNARSPATFAMAEPLIDCEEDRTLRAVLIGKLREAEELPLSASSWEDDLLPPETTACPPEPPLLAKGLRVSQVGP